MADCSIQTDTLCYGESNLSSFKSAFGMADADADADADAWLCTAGTTLPA